MELGKEKKIDQWNRIESPKRDTNIINWFLTKEQKQYYGAKTVSLINGAGATGHPCAKIKKCICLYRELTSFTKMNSKWITDVGVKHKTTKLIEDNVGENLNYLRYVQDFSDTTQKAWSMKEITYKLDLIKFTNQSSVKENIEWMRRLSHRLGKIFAKNTYDKGLLSKIYKELLNLNNKKQTNWFN